MSHNIPNRNARDGRLARLAAQASTWGLLALCLAVLSGCSGNTDIERLRQEMYNQPKYKPLAASTFFKDGRASRDPVPGTVARSQLRADTFFYTGKDASGNPVDKFPFPITKKVLERGQQRYNIFCSPCHDRVGTGHGIIINQGFKHPPSYHIDRLREAPVGHFYDVITNGFGAMYSYNSRIPPKDRWAIVAYIRALQLSQHATLDDVPPAERQQLESQPQ